MRKDTEENKTEDVDSIITPLSSSSKKKMRVSILVVRTKILYIVFPFLYSTLFNIICSTICIVFSSSMDYS